MLSSTMLVGADSVRSFERTRLVISDQFVSPNLLGWLSHVASVASMQ